MPLQAGRSRAVVSSNIAELHKGPQFARTAAKFGAKRANAQAVAIALRTAGLAHKRRKLAGGIARRAGATVLTGKS
jgi:hypothetical protein